MGSRLYWLRSVAIERLFKVKLYFNLHYKDQNILGFIISL